MHYLVFSPAKKTEILDTATRGRLFEAFYKTELKVQNLDPVILKLQ